MLKHVSVVPAVLLTAIALPCLAASHARHTAEVSHASSHTAKSRSVQTHSASSHGRVGYFSRASYTVHTAVVHHESSPAMETGRATEIQAALIRAGYLSGEPSGVWDADSVAAMQKLQDDNGWQTKYTPDSRALMKLGLGPGSTPVPQPTTPIVEVSTAAPADR